MSSSSSTPKDSPATVETFADVLKLLNVDKLEVDEAIQDLAVQGTNRMLKRYGPEWMRENKVRLVQELELLNTM